MVKFEFELYAALFATAMSLSGNSKYVLFIIILPLIFVVSYYEILITFHLFYFLRILPDIFLGFLDTNHTGNNLISFFLLYSFELTLFSFSSYLFSGYLFSFSCQLDLVFSSKKQLLLVGYRQLSFCS